MITITWPSSGYLFPMKILIVDDETLARERLKDLLEAIHPGQQILEADNGLAALAIVEKEAPEIVLLDIRMPVMDGLETAWHLSSLQQPPAVIFTTAYQDHAIQAFELQAVDYLMKPIRRERLETALQRSHILKQATVSSLMRQGDTSSSRSHLSASSYGKIELIPIAEIRYLKAEQKYITVGWSGRESLINESLKSLEQEYPGRFLRIHRNTLVAPEYIQSMQKDKDGTYQLYLKDIAAGFPISRRHLHDVRHTLKHLGLT